MRVRNCVLIIRTDSFLPRSLLGTNRPQCLHAIKSHLWRHAQPSERRSQPKTGQGGQRQTAVRQYAGGNEALARAPERCVIDEQPSKSTPAGYE